jgi:hypothetical protein
MIISDSQSLSWRVRVYWLTDITDGGHTLPVRVYCRGGQAFAIILGCLLCRQCERLQSRYRVSTQVTQYHESSTRRCRVIRPIPVRKSRPLIGVWSSEISRLLGQAPIESKSVAGQVVTTEIRCDVGRWSLIEESEASPHGAASEWSVPVSRRCPFRHRTSPPTCPASALPNHQISSVATVWRCCVLQSSYLSRHPLETRRITTAPEQAHRYRSAVISSVIAIAEKRRSPTTLRLSSSISSSKASYQLALNQTYAPLDATRKVLLLKPLPSTSTRLGLPEHYRTTAPGYKSGVVFRAARIEKCRATASDRPLGRVV